MNDTKVKNRKFARQEVISQQFENELDRWKKIAESWRKEEFTKRKEVISEVLSWIGYDDEKEIQDSYLEIWHEELQQSLGRGTGTSNAAKTWNEKSWFELGKHLEKLQQDRDDVREKLVGLVNEAIQVVRENKEGL